MTKRQAPRVLVIAGSDSGGGAGIQADIKTITRFKAYAATAITAVTVQNTVGVTDIHPIPVSTIQAQIETVLSDIGADVIKIGMLGDLAVIKGVADAVKGFDGPIVLDPVMVATSGDRLIPPEAVEGLKQHLLPLAHVITPNIPEAELLTGLKIEMVDDMTKAGKALISSGAASVVIKGGHLSGDTLTDILITTEVSECATDQKINTTSTHGTGCTFASAMAASLAHGRTLTQAFHKGRSFVRAAIEEAPGLGRGCGPLGHATARVTLDD